MALTEEDQAFIRDTLRDTIPTWFTGLGSRISDELKALRKEEEQ